MRILWLTWKDIRHPLAGGAELVNEELGKKLAADGHQLVYVVGGWKGCVDREERDGFTVIRLGNRYSVYWKAYRYYKKHLKGKFDLVIDECNTMPFFARFYVQEKTVFFIQQLAREIWFYQMPLPFSLLGYILEPLYVRFFRSEKTLTFAASTKDDLVGYGFKPENISILREVYTVRPCDDFATAPKNAKPSVLFCSSLREMKRPDHVIKAFEIAKKAMPDLRLEVIGSGNGKYADEVQRLMKTSPFKDDIAYHGPVSDQKKVEIMRRNHFICCTSVREGWGIIVSEAGCQGTPAIVYDVHGLRDAVNFGEAGVVCGENTPRGLAREIVDGFKDGEAYRLLQRQAHRFACGINIEVSYKLFREALSDLSK
jgi:glycosyltransferase involved in cell wall biosynthesis